MIACIVIPGFPLRAALVSRPSLRLVPAALAPEEGTEPLVGPVTAAWHTNLVVHGRKSDGAAITHLVTEPNIGNYTDWMQTLPPHVNEPATEPTEQIEGKAA